MIHHKFPKHRHQKPFTHKILEENITPLSLAAYGSGGSSLIGSFIAFVVFTCIGVGAAINANFGDAKQNAQFEREAEELQPEIEESIENLEKLVAGLNEILPPEKPLKTSL
jgi:hypothetical protein